MKTENKTSLKKLLPLLCFAAFLLFLAFIFYYFFQKKSIKKSDIFENSFATLTSFEPDEERCENAILLPEGLEVPDCPETFSDAVDHELVTHKFYKLCYRESYEQSEYSAYLLKKENLVKNAERKNNFRADPAVSTKSANQNDYKNSGFDRGHLAPAGDFTFSEEAMSETFFMSNMSPQAPGLNRAIWEKLESQVRRWAEKFGRVYVTCGPILEKEKDEYEKIGLQNIVCVPEYFYKVVLIPLYADEEDEKTSDDAADIIAMAFIFPNSKCEGTFWDYQVSVDEVEKRTGLDFFTKLDKEIENKIESEKRKPN